MKVGDGTFSELVSYVPESGDTQFQGSAYVQNKMVSCWIKYRSQLTFIDSFDGGVSNGNYAHGVRDLHGEKRWQFWPILSFHDVLSGKGCRTHDECCHPIICPSP